MLFSSSFHYIFFKILLIRWRNSNDQRGCYQPHNMETSDDSQPFVYGSSRVLRNVTDRHNEHFSNSVDSENPHLLQSWLEYLPLELVLSISWHTNILTKGGSLGNNLCGKPALKLLSPIAKPRLRKTFGLLCNAWKLSNIHSSLFFLQLEPRGVWLVSRTTLLSPAGFLVVSVWCFFTSFVGSISCEVPLLNKALAAQTIYFSHFP